MHKESPYIIAEIGVNHNKSIEMLEELIYGAFKAGCSCIKMQRFIPSEEISDKAMLAGYQQGGEYTSQLVMAEQLRPPDSLIHHAKNLCIRYGIDFLCSPFDIPSIDFMVESLRETRAKIPSPEITNVPYLVHCASRFDDVILSTGASFLSEVQTALDHLFITNPKLKVSLLHCVSEYPAPLDSLNLRCIATLKEEFGLPVGLSDHAEGYISSISAICLGADIIEKHITLDKNLPGPDHKASITLDELETICSFAKNLNCMVGDGVKRPHPVEAKNRDLIRKSIYVNVSSIEANTVIKPYHLAAKRPYNPSLIQPENFQELLGLTTKTSLSYDEGLSWEMLDK